MDRITHLTKLTNLSKNITITPIFLNLNNKLQCLQYRIDHCIIATYQYLVKLKLTDEPLCTFCKSENESIEHLFLNCNTIQNCL